MGFLSSSSPLSSPSVAISGSSPSLDLFVQYLSHRVVNPYSPIRSGCQPVPTMAYNNRASRGYEAGCDTYSVFLVPLPVLNPLRIGPGEYRCLVGGWQGPCDTPACLRECVGLIVKCSGCTGERQKPEDHEYALWHDEARDRDLPQIVNFPIMYAGYGKGIPNLCDRIRRAWQNGLAVFFHCDRGEVQAIAAICVFLERATGQHAVGWLATILSLRNIAPMYTEILEQYKSNGAHTWIPRTYRDYVVYCRLYNIVAREEDWHRLTGRPLMGGTPRARGDRQYRMDEDAAHTPRGAATPAYTDQGDAAGASWVVNSQRDPAPILRPPAASSRGLPTQMPPPPQTTPSRIFEPKTPPTTPPLHPGYPYDANRAQPPPPPPAVLQPLPAAARPPPPPLILPAKAPPAPKPPPLILPAKASAASPPILVKPPPPCCQPKTAVPPARMVKQPPPGCQPKTTVPPALMVKPPPPGCQPKTTVPPALMAKPPPPGCLPKTTVPPALMVKPPPPGCQPKTTVPPALMVKQPPPGWQPPQQPLATLIDAAIAQQADNIAGQNLLAAAVLAPHFGESCVAPTVALAVDYQGERMDERDESYSLMSSGLYNRSLPKSAWPTLPTVEGMTGLSTLMQPVGTGISGLSTLSVVMDTAGPHSTAASSTQSELLASGVAYLGPSSQSDVPSDCATFLGGSQQTVPAGVENITWDPNPTKKCNIRDDELSPLMQGFLRNHHVDYGDSRGLWCYNICGFHPMHTVIEAICSKQSTFPIGFNGWHDLSQSTKDANVQALVLEAMGHTIRQYESCAIRTLGSRPANNTPLMMYMKTECRVVEPSTARFILQKLIFQGGGLKLVDNHGNNAIMLAAGHGNKLVFQWCHHQHRGLYEECGFDWNQKNDGGRNCLSIVRNCAKSSEILTCCQDLARMHWMDEDDFASDPHRPTLSGRSGGASNSHQSIRAPSVGNRWQRSRSQTPSRR